MTQVGIASDGSSAAVFGIAGMSAGDDHFELVFWISRLVGRGRLRGPDREHASQPACLG